MKTKNKRRVIDIPNSDCLITEVTQTQADLTTTMMVTISDAWSSLKFHARFSNSSPTSLLAANITDITTAPTETNLIGDLVRWKSYLIQNGLAVVSRTISIYIDELYHSIQKQHSEIKS